MNTDTLQWSRASSLPYPLSDGTATVCGARVYLVGALDEHGHPIHSVITCSLSVLLQSQTVGLVWNTSVADLPVKCSASVMQNGELLAVGGYNSESKESSNNIYSYDTETNSWEVISHVPNPRHWCLVTVLPGNKLMVVGGQLKDYVYV